MYSEQIIYSDETLISPYTNKPVSEVVKIKPIIFWCKVCCKKLVTPVSAVKHMSARGHMDRFYSRVNGSDGKTNIVQQPVLKTQESVNKKIHEPINKKTQEPVNKKPRKVVDKSLFNCDDCVLEFDNERLALLHFKGKKHAKVFAAKITEKINGPKGGKQGGGSGGRGRGRGGWIGSQSAGGMGSNVGQLQKTMSWQNRDTYGVENNPLVSTYYGLDGASLGRKDNSINNVPRTNWYVNDSYSNNSQKYGGSANTGNNVPATNVYENNYYNNKSQNYDDAGNYGNNIPSTSLHGNDWYNKESQKNDGGNSDNNHPPMTNVNGRDSYSNNFQNHNDSGNYSNVTSSTKVYGNDDYSNNSQNFSAADSFQNVNSSPSRRSLGNYSVAGALQNSLTSEIYRLKRRLNEI